MFSLLGGVWALASPLFSVPDEPAHAIYAAGAVRGEVWNVSDGLHTLVEVPAEFANAAGVPGCYMFQSEVPAGCAGPFPDDPGTADVSTTAGRYPPAYYIYAGLPTLVTGGAKAVYLMRAFTAIAVGALLASAACSVLEQRRRTWSLIGLAMATTPMLFFFAGGVNPQAPEIAASILVWVSGAALLQALRRDESSPLRMQDPILRRVVVGVVALALARPLSLFWLTLIVLCLVAAVGSTGAVRALLASVGGRLGMVLALGAGAFTLFWVVARNSLGQQDVTAYADTPLWRAILFSIDKLDREYQEMIGYFGWLDAAAPGIAYLTYTIMLGGLLMATVMSASRRQLLAVALLAAAVIVLPPLLEAKEYKVSAFAWQGRYTLPIAVGVPLLLGAFADSRSSKAAMTQVVSAVHVRRALAAFAGGLVLVHVASFIGALNRNLHGVSGFWFKTPAGWVAPLPPAVLIAVQIAACGLMAVLLVRAARPQRATETLEVDGTDAPESAQAASSVPASAR